MAKLNDSQKLLAIGGAGVLLSLLAGGGVYWAQGLIAEEKVAIAAKQKQVDEASVKIKKIPGLEEQVILLRENIDHYVKILPEQDEINNFVRTADDFVKTSGVKIKKFIDGLPKAHGKFVNYSYRIDCTATLWEFLKFVNLFESHGRFVRIKSFSITSGEKKHGARMQPTGADRALEHTISMEVETYLYNGGSKAEFVKIPNYAAKRNKLRNEIFVFAQKINLAHYEYKQSGNLRRDILVDPRSFPDDQNSDDPERQLQQVDAMTVRVDELMQMHDRMQEEMTYLDLAQLEKDYNEKLAQVNLDVSEMDEKNTVAYLLARQKWRSHVKTPLAVLNQSKGTGGSKIDPYPSMDELRTVYDNMIREMKSNNLLAAGKIFESIEAKLGIPDPDPRVKLVRKVVTLNLFVQTLEEFNDLGLKVSGVVVNQDGKSGLLINGDVYEEGDYMEDDLLLKSVGQERATFIYKGYHVVMTW